MKTVIEKTIQKLAEVITVNTKSEDALRLTQAALNLAHVLGVFDSMRSK